MLEDETPPDVATLVLTALVVLVLALAATLLCTRRMARKRGLPSWDAAARRLVRALLVPLLTGGAFCAVLLVRAHYELLPSVMLVFYGLALLQAAPMTRSEVRWLGILELLLGLAAGLWPGWGLLLWGMGFGALHVVYGIVMYLRYDREIPADAPR